jgi:Ulp1 family protease
VAREAVTSFGNDNTIIQRAESAVSRAKPYVTRAHLQSLQPGAWLHGSIVDYYMHCLREREKKAFQTNKVGAKRSFFYRTAFYDYVHPTGAMAAPYTYSQVSKWTKRGVPGNSIFTCDALFFPCNIGDEHWILIVAFMKEKTIQVVDSLHANYRSSVLAIYQYLQDEHISKFNGEPMKDEKEWKLYA